MESHKKKKAVVAAVIVGLLCAAAGIRWFVYKDSQRFTALPDEIPNPNIEDISWMGKGTVTEEDTCLIVDIQSEFSYSDRFDVIPGKCIFLSKSKGKKETFSGDDQVRKKFYWNSIQTLIYDITTGEQVQSIDVKKLAEEYAPGYQYDGDRYTEVFSGKNGHLFFKWTLIDIPEDGEQEIEQIYLCMDYETGEIYLEDALESLYDNTEKQENFEKEFFYDNWKAFMEKNGYTNFRKEGSRERAFRYTYYPSIYGIANIDIAATALPKENSALYSRFPGLQDYQGEAGKTVKIYLGGYPTIEEIQQLFVEEGTERSAGE